jgi:hypothetical protein
VAFGRRMPTHPGANRPDMIKAKRHGHVLFRLLNPLFTHCGPSPPEGFDPLQGTARTYMFSSWMTSGRSCNGAQVTVAAILQAHQLVGLLAAMFADPAPPPVYPMYRQPFGHARVQESLILFFGMGARAAPGCRGARRAVLDPRRRTGGRRRGPAAAAAPKLLKASSTCCWLPRTRA